MRARQKRSAHFDAAGAWEFHFQDTAPRRLAIVGAGTFLSDLVRLVREYPDFELAGILDPDPALKGQSVDGIPILGWLGDLDSAVRATVIGNASSPGGFDREAVFRLILARGIACPIMTSAASRVDSAVTLRRGTVVLAGARVHATATIGENCVIGAQAVVGAQARVPDHLAITSAWRPADPDATKETPPVLSGLEATLALGHEPIRDIIQRINWARMEIILVVDSAGALIGTITDGDIRRGILAGVDQAQPVSVIMNPRPVTVSLGTSFEEMLALMRRRSIRHLPVIDNARRPIKLERLEGLVDRMTGPNAVIMAGGMGARLRPLTNDTPKPLLPVGGRPILDHILDQLNASGIEDVVLSVNYLGEQIIEHVGDGRQHDLHVNYVTEKARRGTAGALSLIRPRPHRPFLVINGDLLTGMNFGKLLQFQKDKNHDLVMCVKRHVTKIAYGVVDIAGGRVTGLREKPDLEYFINAGIYVLKPSCLDLIPPDKFFDMTDLIDVLIKSGASIGAFPVIEYWRDIGRPEDLYAASQDHAEAARGPDHGGDGSTAVPMEALA